MNLKRKLAGMSLTFVVATVSMSAGASVNPLEPQRSASEPELISGFNKVVWGGREIAAGRAIWKITVVSGDKRFQIFRILDEKGNPDGSYTLKVKGEGDPASPTIALEIAPISDGFVNVEWTGFRYRYRLIEGPVPGVRIEESVKWHLDETGEDPTYWLRNIYFATEYVPNESPEFSTSGADVFHSRFGKIAPFDFHEGKGRALLVFPEEPALILNRTEALKNEVPTVMDHFFITPEQQSTPWKHVVYTDEWPGERISRINKFNHLWLELRNYYKQRTGLAPAPALVPIVTLGPRFSQIEPVLPQVREMGFKAISVGPIWTSSATEGGGRASMSVYDFTVADQWGGIEGLRSLCRKAAEYDIRIFAWFPSFHLSDQSPLLSAHPDWKAKPSRPDLYEDKLIPLNLANPALRKRLLEQLTAVREAGVSGFWMDSFHNFGVEAVISRDGWEEPIFSRFLDVLRDMQELGFTLYAEGYTPFITSSFGLLKARIPFYEKAEYRLLTSSPYTDEVSGGSKFDGLDYFALLAFGSPLFLSSHLWPGRDSLWAFSDEEREKLTSWHAQYAKALPDMKALHGLIEDGKAVLWQGETARILFVLENFRSAADETLQVSDLATGEDLQKGSAISFKANTVYRLEGQLPKAWQPSK